MYRFSSKTVAIVSNLSGKTLVVTPRCFISGKSMRGTAKLEKPKPYPYETKPYNIWQAFFDKTSKRIDENSKVILVEGPLAVGKTKFAQELAAELEMKYIPQADMDYVYINPYGYDMRKLDSQMPEDCKSFDINNFLKDPNHRNAAQFQLMMYRIRYTQYIDALNHLLCTGQGVVLERSVYSDFVFADAMVESGFMSKTARSIYQEIKDTTITEILKPHLVVYLDAPVSAVKDKIKARNLPNEANSKALTDKFLNSIEVHYKQEFLKDISKYAELLVYDWSAGGETEVVVEDIERIDFGKIEADPYTKKLEDWRFHHENDWCEARIQYSAGRDHLLQLFNIPRFDCPELTRAAEDATKMKQVWFSAPGMKYAVGYNEDAGDKNVMTKNSTTRVGI